MKSLGWLTGCALALACAHGGKSVVGESDTNRKGTVAARAVRSRGGGRRDRHRTALIRPFAFAPSWLQAIEQWRQARGQDRHHRRMADPEINVVPATPGMGVC